MKLRASTKIAVGFVLTVAGVLGGSMAYTKFRLIGVELTPIESSQFCLLAVGPQAPVRVLTANHMAQIVEVEGGLENTGTDSEGAQTGSIKRRIPVKELLGVLNGNSDSVAEFLQLMRRSQDEDAPSENAPMWTSEDIEKALGGDPILKAKLEKDTNATIDGTPLSDLNLISFYDGIRIKIPVTVNVKNAKGSTLQGFDIVTFRPHFMVRFYKSMQEKFYDRASLGMFYKQFINGKTKEEAKASLDTSLRKLIEDAAGSDELGKLNLIGRECVILANRSMIKSGEMKKVVEGGEETYDLKLVMQGDGPPRLWKFSAEGGKRLLVVSQFVPIASATIGTQLSGEELVIKQITDKNLVSQAVETLR
jgi:hypothetical protein